MVLRCSAGATGLIEAIATIHKGRVQRLGTLSFYLSPPYGEELQRVGRRADTTTSRLKESFQSDLHNAWIIGARDHAKAAT